MEISVIICTHNPRQDYLRRVLDALKAQTLPKEQWELLLIDNASRQSLAKVWDLSWHPHARHIREDDLGLTPARLRGIREARSELLVFEDDDCELEANFLFQALQIAEKHATLGAWGGQCFPVFEQEPPEWTKPFWGHLTVRIFSRERWSNVPAHEECIPWGAGLCIRSGIANAYKKRVATDPILRKLGRCGGQLLSCEDLDMALTSCDEGLGIGVFPQLQLNHLIPKSRTQEDYLLKVVEGHAYSSLVMNARRGETVGKPINRYRRLLGMVKRLLTMRPRERCFCEARVRGQQRALQDIIKLGLTQNAR